MKRPALFVLPFVLLCASCAESRERADAIDAGVGATIPDAMASDSGAMECETLGTGPLQEDYYCDLGAIDVLARDGQPTEVQVHARIGDMLGCARIEHVDVVRGEVVLGTLDEVRDVPRGTMGTLIAIGPASAAVADACADETSRISGYGLIVRGRDAEGPFEARCGSADALGSRWPPDATLACHHNLPAPPGASTVSVTRTESTADSSFFFQAPHPAGRPAVTSVDTTIRVVSPQRAFMAPDGTLLGRDTFGWNAVLSERDLGGSIISAVEFSASGASSTFGDDLCASLDSSGSPPFFLARITGQGSDGPFVAEALVNCYSTGP